MANRWGKSRNSDRFLFSWAPKSLGIVTAATKIKRRLVLGRKSMTNLDNILKAETSLCWQRSACQSYGFSNSHVRMWELDHKGGLVLRNWCFQTVEKTLESPLKWKEVQPVNCKGNQSWIFIGRTDAEAETPILWPPDAKNSVEKTLMLGNIEGRRRGWQRMRWLDGITNLMDRSWASSGSWWWTGRPGVLQSMGSHRFGHDLVTEQQQRHRSPQRTVSPEDSNKLHVHSHIPCSTPLFHLIALELYPFIIKYIKCFPEFCEKF